MITNKQELLDFLTNLQNEAVHDKDCITKIGYFEIKAIKDYIEEVDSYDTKNN